MHKKSSSPAFYLPKLTIQKQFHGYLFLYYFRQIPETECILGIIISFLKIHVSPQQNSWNMWPVNPNTLPADIQNLEKAQSSHEASETFCCFPWASDQAQGNHAGVGGRDKTKNYLCNHQFLEVERRKILTVQKWTLLKARKEWGWFVTQEEIH